MFFSRASHHTWVLFIWDIVVLAEMLISASWLYACVCLCVCVSMLELKSGSEYVIFRSLCNITIHAICSVSLHCILHLLTQPLNHQIDWHVLESRLRAIDGVQDVHDLHIWSISSNTCAMTVHIRVSTWTHCLEVLSARWDSECSHCPRLMVLLGECIVTTYTPLSALYCTVQYRTTPYCTVLYHTALFCTVLYHAALYDTVRHCTMLWYMLISALTESSQSKRNYLINWTSIHVY